jgi:Tol biopolymer transport system component
VASGEIQELIHEPGVWDADPSWSPDKSKIVFVRNSNQKGQIMIMDSDGGALRHVTPELEFDLSSPIWVRQSAE